ncbi:DUF4493 domain-containing protein [Parabacteroides distasonis]|uniref:DUF4493 domain-containing protein n=1 Tax=Parabacteroides distasonis TaxID=823 RepID=UPI0018A927CC|nr:DUF4493 domain-containing protein [Parabacteroides distasonis]
MRLLNYIALSLFALVGFISCEMREEIKSGKEGVDMGLLKLSVQAKSPAVTKATSVSTDDFPVSIVGKSVDGEEVERNYDAVADLPESILLPVGTYSVVSHTKGVLEKKLEAPYYKGSSDMEIKKDITSSAKVTCKMQNSRIQLNYSSEFLAKFTEWTIMLDDGSETALSVQETSANASASPAPIYWYFGEGGAKTVTLNIRAKTIEGNTVTMAPYVFKKEDAKEKYDDVDNPNFTGGEALIIDLKPGNEEDPTTGTVKSISVTISVIFENHNEAVDIPVEDKEETKPDPDPTPTPGGDLSLVLPDDIEMKSDVSDAPENSDATITAKNGLKSMIVRIIPGGNGDFEDALRLLEEREEEDGGPIYFLNGEEMVGNTAVESLFATLGVTLKAPQKGDTSYIFPIGGFFKFMNGMIGAHKFEITLVDEKNEKTSGLLTITLKE